LELSQWIPPYNKYILIKKTLEKFIVLFGKEDPTIKSCDV
jgi:hypothetical protein